MKEEQTPRSTALWEQWLQRLSGIEHHEADLFRVELLELVADSLTDTDQFFTRFGTIAQRCLAVPVLLVQRTDKKQVLFSNINRAREAKIVQVLPGSSESSNTLTERRLKTAIATDFLEEPLRIIYQLPLQHGQSPILLTLLTTNPISVEKRKYLHFVNLLLGIRRRRQLLQNQLVQEQQRLAALTHHLSEGLIVLTQQLDITIWNRPLYRLTGYSVKETLGKPLTDFLQIPGNNRWLTSLIAEYGPQTTKNTFASDVQILTKQRQTKWVNISGSFIRDDNGEITQTIILVRDISHLKELEQRKNEFISIATHELRTPITAVKGYLSLLSKDTSTFSEKQSGYLARATEASERLVRLAEDLLEVVRVEENRMQFTIRPVDVSLVIKKVCHDFSSKAAQKNVEINFTAPAERVLIAADRIRVEQVFANLIDNALKYTKRGGVTITLSHPITANKSFVAVEIKDTGVGIDQKDIAGIFEKFHRTRTAATSRESGVGLGLYIVKSFIEKQGGTITVQSRVGRGSTFTVTFPALKTNKKTRKQ
jgi:PAS domain S-box-containing protein